MTSHAIDPFLHQHIVIPRDKGDDSPSSATSPIPISLFQATTGNLNTLKKKLIIQVTTATLTEAILSVAMVAITCLFIITPGAQVTFIALAVGILAFNAFLRISSAYAQYQIEALKNSTAPHDMEITKKYTAFNNIVSFLCPTSFAVLYDNSLATLIHEEGHALTANLLFQHAKPNITITGPGSGYTQWWPLSLSTLGEKIGLDNAKLMVSAGGSGLAVLSTLGLIVAAHCLQKNHPQISKHLYAMAFMNVITTAIYALSALFPPYSQGHDFAALAAGGIHPLLSFAIIILLPLLLLGLLHLIDKCLLQPSTTSIPIIYSS
ncbi:MAG: hypothetical protein HY860_05215 [Chlamydiales bacterium]|nr:hypothetical protein [Chlamydiales bacterium]